LPILAQLGWAFCIHAQRTYRKESRNFARADAILNNLATDGILLEDSKDSVRWKRK
jgi:cysteinyl-tRNA synthetase